MAMAYSVRVFQHVPFEGPGMVQPLLSELGLGCNTSHLYAGELPQLADGDDALVVLGGPMSVSDADQIGWLAAEKQLVADALSRGFPVLGICLGAQIMAEAMGARVSPMGYREIGWHPVVREPEVADTWLGDVLEPEFMALHWHGEQFELPAGALPLGFTEACQCQGFLAMPQQVGLQFHLEFDQNSVKRLVRNCSHELDGGQWVQSAEQMQQNRQAFATCRQRMKKLVEGWVGTFN